MTEQTHSEIRALVERRLDAAEFEAYVRAPMDAREREETLSLIAWFSRRYPSPMERLQAIRASMRRAEALARAGQEGTGRSGKTQKEPSEKPEDCTPKTRLKRAR